MHWIALQPLPEALPGQGDVHSDDRDDDHGVADLLAALAWQALQFTPKVARVALHETTEALVMEISGSERLFGGRGSLLRLIHTKNKDLAPVKYAQAATSLVALGKLQMGGAAPCAAGAARGREQIGARARSTEPATFVSDSGNQDLTPICSLPLHTLAAARPHLATLARIGCTCWGDMRALPRGGVARRFGADLLDALDRAYGLKPELYPWLTLPEVFAAKIELHAQVETAPALMFGAQRLLRQLQLWLRLRNEGVAALEFGWTMDARRNTAREGALTLRTALATQDIAHLQRLLGENLVRLTLPAPALYVSLRTLVTEPLATQSAPLLLEEAQKGDSLHQMVERLTARLGAENVLQLQTRADYRPETLQKWNLIENLNKFKSFEIPIKGANYQNNTRLSVDNFSQFFFENKIFRFCAATLQADALYPTWLLQQPLPLAVLHGTPQYQGPLTLVAGPERLEAGWWEGRHNTALRDYFIAWSEQAGLLWVFRERLGERPGSPEARAGSGVWYLHGRFD